MTALLAAPAHYSISPFMAYTVSESLDQFIEAEEGCRLTVYPDLAGNPTIGTGRLLHMTMAAALALYPNGITQAQADAFLEQDLAATMAAVNAYVTVQLSQQMFDALVSLTFNIGAGNLHSSTLLRLLNSGDYHDAAQQFLVWNHCNGVVSPGLAKRRLAEMRIFLNGDYTPSTSGAFQC